MSQESDLSDVPLARMPVFVLDTVLMPGSVMPLHVFEPRYLSLVDGARAEGGWFAIGTPSGPGQEGGPPPLHDVLGFGRVVEHVVLEDDRRFLLLSWEGTARVLDEVTESGEPFRRVRCEALPEIQVTERDVSPGLRALGMQALAQVTDDDRMGAVGDLDAADWLDAMGQLMLRRTRDKLAWLRATEAGARVALLQRAFVEHLPMAGNAEGAPEA